MGQVKCIPQTRQRVRHIRALGEHKQTIYPPHVQRAIGVMFEHIFGLLQSRFCRCDEVARRFVPIGVGYAVLQQYPAVGSQRQVRRPGIPEANALVLLHRPGGDRYKVHGLVHLSEQLA